MFDRVRAALLVLFLVILGIYVYGYATRTDISILLVIVYFVVAILPPVVYLLTFGDLGVSWQDKFSVMVFLQWLGTIIWFIAGLLDIYYEVFLGTKNIISEIVYVSGYTPVILGLALYAYTLYRRIGIEFSQRQTIFLVAITILISLSSSIIFWGILSKMSNRASSEYPINVIYVILDGVLLFIIVLSWLSLGGQIERVMKLFMGSALLLVIYDMAYAYLNLQGFYYFGHPIDLLAYSAYLVYTIAFNEVRISLK